MSRLFRLLTKEDFRRHPVRAIYRRLYWRWHWRFRASEPFVVPFFGGLRLGLAPSSASLGIYLNDGFSDKETASLFLDHLRPGMVAVDCGAHIGEYTLLFALLVGPEGEVHAFEPDPRVFSILSENIRRNGLRNVWTWQKALGRAEGVAEFLLAPDATASSLARLIPVEEGEKVEVAVTSLDAYAGQQGLTRVDALKVDVEGAEEEVLVGAQWLLSVLRPGFIEIECHGDPRPVVKRLESHGYSTAIRQGSGHLFPHVVARREKAS